MLIAIVPAVAAIVAAVLLLLLRSARGDRLRRGVTAALPLVPVELADAHARVVALGDPAATRAADELVLDVAIVLVGRPAKGGAQHRFVQTRTAELQERHDVLVAARAEVDALSGFVVDEPEPERDTALSRIMFVVLLPGFVAWDGTVAAFDAVALRLRAAGRVMADALRRWRHVRAALVAATRRARRRFVAARLRAARARS